MTKISFIYFDVGGVVIKDFSDTPKWKELGEHLQLTNEQFATFDQIYRDHVSDIARGNEPTDVVIGIFLKQTGITLPNKFSLEQYFVDNFGRNESIWPIIDKVAEKYRIGLLTDMFLGMFQEITERDLFPPTEWDVIIDSSAVGLKKPMPEIYSLATDRAGVPTEEILFIDNAQKNLEGAKQAGWQTYLYDSNNYDQANLDLANFLDLSEK